MERILCLAPIFDEVTEITYEESRDLVKYAMEHDVEVVELVKDDVTRENVEELLKQYPNVLVYHADHGNETSWIGSDAKPCVDLENVELLRERECYCNNCSSAKELGVKAWKLKAIYWGYTEVFVFTTDAKEEFQQFINNGIKRKIDGHKWMECLKMTMELANKLIDKLVKMGKALAASCMRWDADHLVCYTPENPPEESDCLARKAAIKLFGPKVGWKLSRTFPISVALFFLGFGIALGKLTHTLWEIGGLKEVFSWQGDYVGYILMFVGFLLAYYQIWSLIKSKI